MSLRTPEVTAVIAAHLIGPRSDAMQVSLRLDYCASDPYAIYSDFTGVDGVPTVTWVLARDLISQGLRSHEAEPAGLGDVRVWRDQDPDFLLISLHGSAGIALIAAPAKSIQRFLLATRALVPYGSESTRIDPAVEALLASIRTH